MSEPTEEPVITAAEIIVQGMKDKAKYALNAVVTLPHPLPAELGDAPVVVLAAGMHLALVVNRDGEFTWRRLDALRAKFPPDGPYRLLFGWAEKGSS